MTTKEIEGVLKVKPKQFSGKDAEGRFYKVNLYWYKEGWRTLDYLRPEALRIKVNQHQKSLKKE